MMEPTNRGTNSSQLATFGGGCFWCTEAIFQRLQGVSLVKPGYMGGAGRPSYEMVSQGTSEFVEVIQIEFDSNIISFQQLLDIFFDTHDPRSLNAQGNDRGPQYASVIFFHNEEQHEQAQDYITELSNPNSSSQHIQTRLLPAQEFWPAESEHNNFYNLNTSYPYCDIVISPKIKKLEDKRSDMLKS